MARPSSYPVELRQRAVRMVIEIKSDYSSEYAAIEAVAKKFGYPHSGDGVLTTKYNPAPADPAKPATWGSNVHPPANATP
jgi:hypothetical protein